MNNVKQADELLRSRFEILRELEERIVRDRQAGKSFYDRNVRPADESGSFREEERNRWLIALGSSKKS
jgi:hypothetical protein